MRHRRLPGRWFLAPPAPWEWDGQGWWFRREPGKNRQLRLDQLSYARPAPADDPTNKCQHQQDNSYPKQETECLVESAYKKQDDRDYAGDYQECVH